MKNKINILLGIITVLVISCKTSETSLKAPVYIKAPTSDLGHIDLVLDSTSFYSIINDPFLTGEFGLFFRDTVTYGDKQSYDIYLAGQENFFHISLAKGYWQDKAGSGVVAFQTRRPDMKDSLLVAWKQYYDDSLKSQVYKGDGYELGEVMAHRPKDERSDKQAVFFSNLTSFSKQSLTNWEMSDSSIAHGISMREFMKGWDQTIPDKLFKKITQLNLQITQNEFKNLESALKTVGYVKAGESFTHETNPKIFYEIVSEEKLPKYKRIEIELSRPVDKREFSIADSYDITVSGKKMIWSAK